MEKRLVQSYIESHQGQSNPTEHDLLIFIGALVYSLMDDIVKLAERNKTLEFVVGQQQKEIARLNIMMKEWI